MKFKKKPIIVEAEQWFPGKLIEGVQEIGEDGLIVCFFDEHGTLGKILVKKGDWIITEADGKKYFCKDYNFQNEYEKVHVTNEIQDSDQDS